MNSQSSEVPSSPRYLPNKVVLVIGGMDASFRSVGLAVALSALGISFDVLLTSEAGKILSPAAFSNISGCRSAKTYGSSVSDSCDGYIAKWATLENHIPPPDMLIITSLPANVQAVSQEIIAILRSYTDAERLPVVAVQEIGPFVSSLRTAAPDETFPQLPTAAVWLVRSKREMDYQISYDLCVIGAMKLALSARYGNLVGYRLLITAGGTREPIDPVRFITNKSSGKMGYALAEAARDRRAQVMLVSSARHLPAPIGVDLVNVETVAELRNCVLTHAVTCNALIMAAAVADYRCRIPSKEKIKKNSSGLRLELTPNENFIKDLPIQLVKVGFAAETEIVVEEIRRKMIDRGFDLICANNVSQPASGFEVNTNQVSIVDMNGLRVVTPLLAKYDVAHIILDELIKSNLLLERRRWR